MTTTPGDHSDTLADAIAAEAEILEWTYGSQGKRPDGTDPRRAYAHVGPSPRPNRSDNAYGTQSEDALCVGPTNGADGNGFEGKRVRAHVGPESDVTRSHGANGEQVMHVGPILDGNTDTRGLVAEEERVQLQPFGADVRVLRKAAGLTQEQLGKLAGIGTTHISRLEQGRRRPSVDAIKALARVLAPAGSMDAVEQRLGALAGDSLREGAARRKRRVENKHRRAAAAEMVKLQSKIGRIIAHREMSGLPVNESLRNLSGLDLSARLRPVEDEPGITGIVPRRAARDAREEVRELIQSMKRRRR